MQLHFIICLQERFCLCLVFLRRGLLFLEKAEYCLFGGLCDDEPVQQSGYHNCCRIAEPYCLGGVVKSQTSVFVNDLYGTLNGEVDKVYVRVDENKAYWVRGDETGAVDLW